MSLEHRDGSGEMRSAVLAALQSHLRSVGVSPADVDGSFRLLGSGLLDSLAMVDLLVTVEEALGQPLHLEEIDFEHVETLDSLVRELERLRVGDRARNGA